MKSQKTNAFLFFATFASLLAMPALQAQNHYWDSNGSTGGFGSTTGTWGTSAFWTTVAGGGATHSAVTNLTTDHTANFGSASANYGNATVGVAAGGVTATSIVFGAGQTTALTIGSASSGTITLGGATRTIVANVTGHTISSELVLTGATTVQLAHALNSSTTTLTLGKLSGTGGVTFENTAGSNPLGTFILTQASTYSGNTILQTTVTNSRAELQLGIANALPTTTVLNMQGSNGATSQRTTSLNLAGYNQTLGGLSNSGGGALRTFRVFSTTASTLTINDSGTRTFSGLIGNGGTNIAVVKDGSGTWTLSGNNSFANGLTLKGDGAVTFAHSNAAGTGTINLQSTETGTGATVNLTSNINVANAIVIDSSTGRETFNSNGNNTLSGNITIDNAGSNSMVFINNNALDAGTTFTVGGATPNSTTITAADYTNTLSFRSSNSGNFGVLNSQINAPNATVNVNQNGSWTFNSTGNTWAVTSFSAATGIVLGADDALATGANLNFAGSATGSLDLNGKNQTVAGLVGGNSAATNIKNDGGADSILTISGLTADRSYAGVIGDGTSNTTSLVVNNATAFTQTLTGTNTYTGTTDVNQGKLIVDGNISTSLLTTVASGATIAGSGAVGALTIESGGTVAPGNSPGVLDTGDYTQAGNYNAEINGLTAGTDHDQIDVTGTVDITGGSLSAIFGGGTYFANDLIFILLNDLSDAITGTYTGFTQGAVVANYGGFDWQISYVADSVGGTFTAGNDIALMAVPEPGAMLLGGIGVLLILRRRRA